MSKSSSSGLAQRDTSFRFYRKGSNHVNSKWFKKCIKKFQNNQSTIILTWKNSTADLYNKLIRQNIHHITNEQYQNKFMVGDYAMFTKYYKGGIVAVDDSDKPLDAYFYTANMVRITSIATKYRLLYDWNELIVNEPKTNTDNAYNTLIKKIMKFQNKFIVNIFEATKIVDNIIDTNIYVIRTIDRDDLIEYNKMLKNIEEHLKHFYSVYKSDEHSDKLWEAFYYKLKNQYAELSFGYSITTHKAQGSTFGSVMVDVADICENPDVEEYIKALYTATTRASNELGFIVN